MKNLLKRIDGISVRMLLSYFSILLVPLLVVVALYGTAMDAILVSRQETALNALRETAHIVTARVEELRNISSYIHSDPNTNAIVNRSRFEQKNRDIYAIYQAIGSLPNYKLTNQMIKDVFIFFNDAEFVIKQPNAFANTRYNYDSHADFRGVSYEQLLALSRQRYAGYLLVSEDERGRDVLLLRSIPNSLTPSGLIVIQLELHALDSLMGANDTGPGGGAYILSREGLPLSAIGDAPFDAQDLARYANEDPAPYREISHQGERYLLCRVQEGDLIYLTLTGKKYLLENIAPIKHLMSFIGSAAFLLGSLLCIALWRRRSRVVKNITTAAQKVGVGFEPARSESHLLESTVNTLANTVGTLREAMDRQLDALRQTVVQSCLHGTFPSRAEMLRQVSALSLDLSAPRYHVVRVSLLDPWFPPVENAQILPYRIFLKRFFAEHLEIPHVASDIDVASFALLLIEREAHGAESLAARFRALSGQVGRQDWVVPSFSISEGCGDLWDVKSLYAQTEEIAGYMALLERRGVFCAEDLPQSPDTMYFPMEVEIRFMQSLRHGTRAELEAVLDEILRANLQERSLDAAMLRNLFEALRHSILRALQDAADEPDIGAFVESLSAVRSLNGLRNCAVRAQQQVSRVTQIQSQEENQQIKEILRQYIEENLSNPALNLYMVSKASGISESTLYRTFKDYFGMSFAGYLEQRRINLAFELLKEQGLIKDVAERVGYTSDHTFRRAFKRVMKVPPSQLAKLTKPL